MSVLARLPTGESIPYAEAIANKRALAESEERSRLLTDEMRILNGIWYIMPIVLLMIPYFLEQKEALARDKSRLQAELAATKDALAAKNAHHNSLLAELAQVRQQLVSPRSLTFSLIIHRSRLTRFNICRNVQTSKLSPILLHPCQRLQHLYLFRL